MRDSSDNKMHSVTALYTAPVGELGREYSSGRKSIRSGKHAKQAQRSSAKAKLMKHRL